MTNYPKEQDTKYKEQFEKYPYSLSIFQKYAIEAIIEGQHVLITAHTGSGKTLPAEFAIEHFVSLGKKVIYTGPIKSLINQKFYDFTHKYPNITFGILTGDIKANPDADVLIVTAEILLNKLYEINTNEQSKNNLSFDIDFQNELGCVIMDEVHYINDKDRGHVWENTIMMLPKHVQMVMLSATIDKPEQFALWCENIHNSNKQVYLTNTNYRVVPLTHYSFITITQGIFKKIKDKTVHEEIKSLTNKLLVIQDSNGKFNDENFNKINNMLKLFDKNDMHIKRQNVLNQVTKYLVDNEMLPALCFVLSRKQLEICAEELTTNLLEFDSKVPYIIDRECEQIIRKLPNYQEYLNLPEYIKLIRLLRKGVAIHHSGIMPVFKEMVELLYSKGYIKVLFATETFSVGVNMPTKTVIFTDIYKFDGNHNRILYSHEYTQMAGRAGRRNIDTVGHVIHLNNIFNDVEIVNYKLMMNGKPQVLTSKFKISYNLILNLNLSNENSDMLEFLKKSMITNELDIQLKDIYYKMSKLHQELDNVILFRTPENIIQEYCDLIHNKNYVVNKKRKEIERRLQQILDNNKYIDQDIKTYNKRFDKKKEIKELEKQYDMINNSIKTELESVIKLLTTKGFIEKDGNSYKISFLGRIAANLREIHPLVFSTLILSGRLTELSCKQLVGLFSCFTNIVIPDDIKDNFPNLPNSENKLKEIIDHTTKLYDEYNEAERDYGINTGCDYNIHYDLVNYVMEWCECDDVNECKILLNKMEYEKQIFLGEFVKALLKINNISSELEKIAEINNDIELLSRLREISLKTLKFVVTNQSLYI